ncbi:MAG: molybdopterin-dependent oxidoreductase, partial [Nitrospirales bacterium]|nr:molybdopterin-dependent oxidoreductase [Nitrospirales bacterium]
KRIVRESYDDPIIVRNMERCVLCSRCVRMCEDVQGAHAIAITNRGNKSFVEPFSGGRYNCESCGNCLTVCPVGAIMSRLHKHAYRPWLIEKEVETVCSYCGVGCSFVAQTRAGSIVRVVPKLGSGLNKGLLCGRGRFGYDYISSGERLIHPLIRRNGSLERATWAEALQYIADSLKTIKENNGGSAIGGVASGRCTNEENYLFQKFLRVVAGTNNVDSVAGFAYAPAQRFLEGIFGQGVTANTLYGIGNSDGIFVMGGDPSAVNPVLGLQVRGAFKKGVPVVTIGSMPGLKSYSSQLVVPGPFGETALLSGIVSLLKERKGQDDKSPLGEMVSRMKTLTADEAAAASAVPVDRIRAVAETLSLFTNPSVIIGRDVVTGSDGETNLALLAALIYLLNGRVYLLSAQPNEQGLVDMGCLPDTLPGVRPLSVEIFRKRYEESLGASIPADSGLSLGEMIGAAHSGELKALYVMGENILAALPGKSFVDEALSRLDLLVVQDIFLNETARRAHVVLPALAWAEKEGTYTNLERRMQLLRRAVDGVRDASMMEDWRIITEISRMMGFAMDYKDTRDIMAEIGRVSPLHKDITPQDTMGEGSLWPYKGEPLRHGHDLPVLPDTFLSGKKAESGKVYLMQERHLFYSETLSRNSAALQSIAPEPYARIGKSLAAELSLSAGDRVSIATAEGELTLPVVIDQDLPGNLVAVPNSPDGRNIFAVMGWAVNSGLKSPLMDPIEAVVRKTAR